MKARALLAALATTALFASGCAAGEQSSKTDKSDKSASAKKSGHDDPSMADMDMGGGDGPSDPAAMICGEEIRDAVKRSFAMADQPTSKDTWSKSDRLYSCTYAVPRGALEMSVQDSMDLKAGRAYFDRLRSRLSGAKPIKGLESFGFPAVSSASGNVAYLKDGKTLRVDASSLSRAALPDGFSREEVAFGVASAVIACWTE